MDGLLQSSIICILGRHCRTKLPRIESLEREKLEICLFPFRWNGILVNRCVKLWDTKKDKPYPSGEIKHCATQLGYNREVESFGECSGQLRGEKPLCDQGLIHDMHIS